MSALPTTTLGRTGHIVTRLAYGAMELRGKGSRFSGPRLDDAEVTALLNAVLDAGINLIDTSPDYGDSEEHIGRCISGRRDEYFLASKCGCPVGDAVEFDSLNRLWKGEDWKSGQCVIGGVKSNVGHLLTGAGAHRVRVDGYRVLQEGEPS